MKIFRGSQPRPEEGRGYRAVMGTQAPPQRVVHEGDFQPPEAPTLTGEVTRKKNRVRIQIGLAVVALLVAFGALIRFVPIITISSFEVRGATHTSQQDIIEAAGLQAGDNMAAVNTGAAARAVVKLPWVRKATVSRDWPRKIVIDVTEATPTFYVDDGGIQVYDEAGAFVATVSAVDPATTGAALKLAGPIPEDEDLRAAVGAIAHAIATELPGVSVDHLAAANQAAVSMVLTDGRTVMWGTTEDLESKVEAVKIVLSREGKNWNVSNPAQVTVS